MKDVSGPSSIPLVLHSRTKKIVVPDDVKGMKIRRPRHHGEFRDSSAAPTCSPRRRRSVTSSSGVADAVTFPWGRWCCSASTRSRNITWTPLYVTTFAFVMNKDNTTRCRPAKKAIDDNCNTEAAGRVGEPWGFERRCRQIRRCRPRIYKLTPEQLVLWKASDPLVKAPGQKTGIVGRGNDQYAPRSPNTTP